MSDSVLALLDGLRGAAAGRADAGRVPLEALVLAIRDLTLPTAEDLAEPSEAAAWERMLEQAAAGVAFLLAAVPDVEVESAQARLTAGREERRRLHERRADLLAALRVNVDDIEALRGEVAFLTEAVLLQSVRDRLGEGAVERSGRRKANERLAAQARDHRERLQAIEADVQRLEAEREALLKDDIEQGEAFWASLRKEEP